MARKKTLLADDNRGRILTIVCLIPQGNVATYGQIAKLAGIPRNARQVGSVLKSLPGNSSVPWYRVVNSRGEISLRPNSETCDLQRDTLESENIVFDQQARISLDEYGWDSK